MHPKFSLRECIIELEKILGGVCMKTNRIQEVTTSFFREILPQCILAKTNEDIMFYSLVDDREEFLEQMLNYICKKKNMKPLFEKGNLSVGHAYEESLDLWLLRIHNEIPECTAIRNFYTLFQIKDREAVARECYLSYDVDEERFCGRFIEDGSLKFFENEFLDEDDETDTIVNHYRKKYKLISNIAS